MSSEIINKNHRILIIDDNEAIHSDFKKILTVRADKPTLSALESAVLGTTAEPTCGIKYEIDSAFQGQEAYEKIAVDAQSDASYALAFVDMRMPPGWDGLETIEKIWKIDPSMQIVICTAYSDYEWDEIHRRFGQSDGLLLLKKPFDSVEVAQLACAMTEKWNLARQARLKTQELEGMVQERTIELRSANEQLEEQIAQKKAAEDRLRHDAYHDALTGLPNRALLMDRLERCNQRAKRDPNCISALLFLDVDNFKLINDSLGHAAGDILLKDIAARLVETLRATDSVSRSEENLTARLGGDEFVLLLDGIKNIGDAALVAERIQQHLAAPFDICGHQIVVTTSLGIAVIDSSCKTAEDILRDSDTAMYRAKSAGKARHAVFDDAMHAAAMDRLQMENDLRRAIEARQFTLEYQPIVELEPARVAGFEALVRWNHPTRGSLEPSDFISVAEETGLIVPLGAWVLEEALRQSVLWNASRNPEEFLPINVNISKRQLMQNDFIDEVRRILAKTGAHPRMVRFEITESVIMDNPDTIVEKLGQIRELGLGLHMDDFGTGQSSLGCLQNFPFDVLKIDRSFVNCMGKEKKYVAIIHAIINLAHNLNMKIVAEGVETQEQLAQLVVLNCDYGQGFLFSQSLPADEASKLVGRVFTFSHESC